MEKYVCVVCGWIYDEAVEGVKFEDQPDDWFRQHHQAGGGGNSQGEDQDQG